MMYRIALTGACASAFMLSACSQADADRTSASREGIAPSATEQTRLENPTGKETSTPADDRLGVLPEGVGIPIGERAPDFALPDAAGTEFRLSRAVENGPVLLVFYRGGWCPYCNFQIRELTNAYPQFRERGITPVAVSVDRIEESARTQARYDIPFPVVSDPDLIAHRAFRVMNPVDDALVERYREHGLDLEESSGRDHHVIAVPSIFVIDRSSIVRWAHADADYKTRPSTEQILRAVDGLDPSIDADARSEVKAK